jgi:outer membrane receptor protein involved in Fe transport
VGDLMVFYTGAEGELNQNTYCDFVSQNPFLSPTLAISPTDKKFDLFAGLKGKLVNNVSYNVRASYLNENDKALFKSNDYSEDSTNENYAFGNSMSVVYDDVKTLSFYGELKADINEVITFGINGTFSSYNTGSENEAWNLPGVKISSTLDVAITNQWYTGVNLFYVGERKDQKLDTSIVYTDTPDPVAVAGYFDLNAHLGYKYNDRLTLFLKLNNITGKSYEKWLDYPVQGFQIVLGANYKFDF